MRPLKHIKIRLHKKYILVLSLGEGEYQSLQVYKRSISIYYTLYIIYYHPELNISITQLKTVILWSNGVLIVYTVE